MIALNWEYLQWILVVAVVTCPCDHMTAVWTFSSHIAIKAFLHLIDIIIFCDLHCWLPANKVNHKIIKSQIVILGFT